MKHLTQPSPSVTVVSGCDLINVSAEKRRSSRLRVCVVEWAMCVLWLKDVLLVSIYDRKINVCIYVDKCS